MSRVKAFEIPGVQMWFYSGDHRPPHFHARKPGQWQVRVYIQAGRDEMIEIVRPPNARLRGKDVSALRRGVQQNRSALLKEWEASQGV
jgi:hypothetical protein